MAIPENQLETWSHQGSKAQSASTYQRIRDVLNDSKSPYFNRNYDVFLQGSYGNDTNIYADSDVDVVICLSSAYYDDLRDLNEQERERYKVNWIEGSINFEEFKSQVLSWLISNFGAAVRVGKKAIFIPGNGNRRDADVLVCVEHRAYTSYGSSSENSYRKGICFWTSDQEKVVNYPRQHLENCVALNGATTQRFKSSVRVLKNLRNAMIEREYIASGLAPSYFLEGMLSNVPAELFVANHQQTLENYMRWFETCNVGDLTCANGIHYLLRDNHSVCWNVADFNEFRSTVFQFYNQP